MISRLSAVLAPLRPHIFGFIGVLLVASLGVNIMGGMMYRERGELLQVRKERIDDLIQANEQLAEVNAKITRINELERENTVLLREQIDLINQKHSTLSEQLKRMEQTNAEVKEYMARPVPRDLKRLLDNH